MGSELAVMNGAPALPFAHGADELLRLITGRRSVPPRRLFAPGPAPEEIEQIVRAACSAPDHKSLEPFRFEWIDESEREALADLFEAAHREFGPVAVPEALSRERERAKHAPVLLALILRERDDVMVSVVEQHASAGAALAYALLAAECLGYGAMAVSGEKIGSGALRKGFALGERERLLCFIAIGTPAQRRGVRPKPDLPSRLRRWTPPIGT